MLKEFYKKDSVEEPVRDLVSRRMLAHHGGLMILEVYFHKASEDYALHTHPHEQIAYVLKGSFEFLIQDTGEKCILSQGDSIYFEPNSVHGGKPLEDDSVLLDIFTPQREDFLASRTTHLPK